MANLTLIQAVNDGLKTAMTTRSSSSARTSTKGCPGDRGAHLGVRQGALPTPRSPRTGSSAPRYDERSAPGRGDPVPGLHLPRLRSDRQRGGQAALPPGRPHRADGHPHAHGGGIRGGLYHSQSGEAYFAHTAGLKVVILDAPRTKALLASIQDPDPVLFMEPKALYRSVKGEVPEGDYTVDLSTLRTVREGRDVTVYCYGAMVPVVEKAAAQAKEQRGIDCLVVDLRTLLPLDEEGVIEAAKQTGRVVVVHEAPRFCGYGAEISALIAEHCIEYMEAPVKRVTGFDTPFPNTLEHHYLPDDRRVLDAIEAVHDF